ncbi:MAG: xanthine dehydrogenase family protein molybdopterin-binding subunit [Pseudomonadota bacterium]|nr:xanthine dehydrogenase family protein molybdopterin-binding subunit [Pseudomonadota bacterium]
MGEFGISQPVRRKEDQTFLMGRGKYVDDIRLERMLYAHILRSPHAHASIESINTTQASAVKGVHLVMTGSDYTDAGLGSMPYSDPPTPDWDPDCIYVPNRFALAIEAVRFVGDGVALIIADTLQTARDAAELIQVDYKPLPAAIGTETATKPNTPAVWSSCPDNIAFVHQAGDKMATELVFDSADHVITRKLNINRVTANSIEPRGILADYDKNNDFCTIYLSAQSAFGMRDILANKIFGEHPSKFRVITNDVGGSFGMKGAFYPEYALAVWASRKLGVPVKWIEDRTEAILTDHHGRDNVTEVSLALNDQGSFLGLKVKTTANLGAYLSTLGAGPPTIHLGGLVGVYTIPAAHVTVTGVFTHTCSTAAYRGAGRPEASFVIETTIEAAAKALGIDSVEIRRRNMIPPGALPYQTPLYFNYDSGRFEETFLLAVKAADLTGFQNRKAETEKNGKLRGMGIAYAIERAAPPGFEYNEMKFGPDGFLTIYAGTTNHGQGHHTMYCQIASEYLGIGPEDIEVIEGDTGEVRKGFGTGGSRVSAMGSSAAYQAAELIIEKAKILASHMLEASESDVTFSEGVFTITGTDRSVTLKEVATTAFNPSECPPGFETGLSGSSEYRSEACNYPNGCHICEVEIDPETGKITVEKYTVVDDVGVVINPLLLDGQIHGGIAQGLGQILFEDIAYDHPTGQMLTGSLMDYAMPRSDDLPHINVEANPVPTSTNPLGIKGAGEAGTIGAMPCVMNAAIDALSKLGVSQLDMPLTPNRTWRAIQSVLNKS